jgi:hypothetical protein
MRPGRGDRAGGVPTFGPEDRMVELAKWQNYYVIIGPSGAALIGIQFVVVTLLASLRRPATAESLHAFGTPTVVHLGGALLVSAIMSVPWPSLVPVSAALAICGLGGLGYGAIVIRRARRQTGYRPVWDDWLWYDFLPFGMYAALSMAALTLHATTQPALFVIGGAALGLLLVEIRNAWDSVTHIVVTGPRDVAKGLEERSFPAGS